MTTLLRNRWYVGAWSNELQDKPVGRKILGEDIVFYRTESKKAVALAGRCPHRFAPLAFGKVRGENLKCVYHGLQFGPDGKCALNPDGSKPPPIGVKAYDIIERNGAIWIWMGDEKPAGEPPNVLDTDPELGGFIYGLVEIGGNYQLLVDNLLDSAHATHLHAAFETEGHVAGPRPEVSQEGDIVRQKVFVADSSLIPAFHPLVDKPSNVDMALEFMWEAPSTIWIGAWFSPPGRPREEGFHVLAIHLITPETETSSHYFWFLARTAKKEDHALTAQYHSKFQEIFLTEDKWVIEGQEAMMAGQDFWALRPALLPQDRATAMCRRQNDKLLAEQAKASTQAA